MSRDLTGTLLVLLSTAGYAFFSILTKIALGTGMLPFDLALWRFVLAAAIFWASFPLWRKWARLSQLTRRDIITMLLLGVLFTGGALTAFFALGTSVTASTYTLLVNTSPALVALLSVLMGDRLSMAAWGAVGMALVGSALTLQGDLGGAGVGALLLPILNAIFIAFYVALAARFTSHIPGITSGIFVITGALATLLVFSLFWGIHLPPPGAWWPVLGIAVFGTVVGIAALLAGMNYMPAYRASLIQSAGPPATLIMAALILGDHLTAIQLIGGALILASVVLVSVVERRLKLPPSGAVVT